MGDPCKFENYYHELKRKKQAEKPKEIYLDYGATTPVHPKVLDAILPYLNKKYGNPSSLHFKGKEAAEALETSREILKEQLKIGEGNLIFTSGGTESNNLALKGIAFKKKKGKIIISAIEHACVFNTALWLRKIGFEIEIIKVDDKGFVFLEHLERAIDKNTFLVSIIHGNNEIGTLQNLKAIKKICEEHDVVLHTDACQSFCKAPITLKHADLITINSHKIYGPKGVGALALREDLEIEPLLHGGGHETNLRSGTENVPGIVGFAAATKLFNWKARTKMRRLRDYFIKKLSSLGGLNGPRGSKRLCNNINFSFRTDGESLLYYLNKNYIYASLASACSSRKGSPSHVLKAIGLDRERIKGSLRFTLGLETSKQDLAFTLDKIKEFFHTTK
ncbi:MAG: cysteine desulfurase family protein [Candidatus Baldrarchaeia archaeon]